MTISSITQFTRRLHSGSIRRLALLGLTLCVLSAPAAAQTPCASKVLVSAYFTNNANIYNGCTGAFERTLDETNRIRGAQATRLVGGKIYLVSEGNDRILRYDATTYAYEGIAINLPVGFGGTGLAISGDDAYVAGYNTSSVNRYSLSTGQLLGVAVAPNAAGLAGADNGAVFGPDGKLYVPGYDSHTVVRFDPATGVTTPFINGSASALFELRGILFEPNGTTVLVSGEGSGEVQRFNASTGSFIAKLVIDLDRPTGLAYGSDGSLLVAHSTGVSKYRNGARQSCRRHPQHPKRSHLCHGFAWVEHRREPSRHPVLDFWRRTNGRK